MSLSGSVWQQRQAAESTLNKSEELAGSSAAQLPDFLQQIYLNRGVRSHQELDYSLAQLPRPDALKDLDPALAILHKSLDQQKNILIVGDYDADGATSTSLLLSALKEFGFANVDYFVPDRFTLGYGLTTGVVEAIVSETASSTNSLEKPDVIITVDNGISSIRGVEAATQQNIEVLVTDHHLPGEHLPLAAAIINPNQPGCIFPAKNLAGVGVVFYLLIAFRSYLLQQGSEQQQTLANSINLADYLDLVAIGTVADLVPLDAVNRCLVSQGLARIRAGKTRPGVIALMEVANKDWRIAQASDIGFTIGPRLNAAGRMDDMSIGIECLLSRDQTKAELLAAQLDGLNFKRREVEAGMRQQAEKDLQALHIQQDQLPTVLSIYQPSWHEGVVGIVAGRIKDKFYRPVFAFAKSTDGVLKGSARSVKHIHIRDVLADLNAANPDLIQRFGGHAMAAGLSIKEADFDRFSSLVEQYFHRQNLVRFLKSEILFDAELPAKYLELSTAELIQAAGPWGQGFEEPVFVGDFTVKDVFVLKDAHLKFKLIKQEKLVEAIIFNVDVEQIMATLGDTIKIAYTLDINQFRGRRSLQLMIRDIWMN